MRRLITGSFLVILLLQMSDVSASPCDPSTPVFTANLTGAPDSNWFSPSIKRDGYCCSAAGSDVCIEFILTLDSMASGIAFNIASGAVPPGALYYQVNCGVPIMVGTQICLTGAGPHLITFCKPGNNPNSFSITSIPETNVQLGVTPLTSPKCPGIITVKGLDEASISCTAMPANPAYDAFLNCTSGCDTIVVTPSGSFPLYVDYLVCGLPVGGCATATYCDTVRVRFSTDVAVSISPHGATLCNGVNTTTLTATATGGTSNYQYLWNTGQTTTSIVAGAGTYTMTVTDSALCATATDVVTISVPAPIIANAGSDRTLCANVNSISLNGSVQTATGGIWSGGGGTFTPSSSSLTASYTPSAGERTAGFVNLVLQTTGNQGCPPAYDTVRIFLPPAIAVTVSPPGTLLCNGVTTTTLTANHTGGIPPYSYSWNTGQTTKSIVAGAGNYSVTVTDSFLCSASATGITITVHPLITANAGVDKTLCSNVSAVNLIGTVQNATGGLWSGGSGNFSPSNSSLTASYTPTAGERTTGFVNLILQSTGNGGCPAMYDTVRIYLPPPILVNVSPPGTLLCNGVTTTTLTANHTGGIPPYSYSWNTGQTTPSIVAGAGNYSVTVADSFLCTASASSVTITVHLPITANAGADKILCSDVSAVNLNGTVQNATGGLWSGGGGNFSPSNTSLNVAYSPTTAERSAGFVNLILQTTGNGGCPPAFDTVRIDLPSAMQLSLSQPSTLLCNGSTTLNLSVTAAGGIAPYQYRWNTGQTTQSIVAGAGTYTVTVTDQASCTSVSSSVTITIMPPVIANAGSTVTLCANSTSVNLNGSVQNATGGLWSGGGGSFSPSNTALNVSYTPSASDRTAGFVNLVLETTGNGGCPPAYDTVRIDLPSAIQVSLSQPPNIILCDGSSNITLSATAVGGLSPYQYRWNTGQTTQSILAGAGTFTVTVSDVANCSAVSSSVTITVRPPISVNAGIPATICPTTPSVNLNGSIQNASGGIWRGGNGMFVPENTALNASYTPTTMERNAGFVSLVLETTGNNGCPALYDTVIFILAPQPSPSIAGSVMLCANSSVNYSVPIQTGNSYYWSASGGVVNGSPTSNTTNVTWSNSGSGSIVITETNTYGCSATHTLNVTMVANPNPVISGLNNLCQFNTESYSVTPVPGSTYQWDISGGTVIGVSNSPSIQVSWTSNGTGSIRVTERNSFGCEQSFFMPVVVKERPVPAISGSAMGCTGNTYTYSTPMSANTNYAWTVTGGNVVSYNGANSVNVTWSNGSIHAVSLFAVNTLTGCDSTVVFNVQVAPIVPPVIQASSLSGCPPLSVQFTGNAPAPGQSYAWSFGDEFFSSSSNPSHIYELSGTFNLVLITRNNTGCRDTITATINVFPVPVASFTHNFESGNYYVGEDTLAFTNTSTGATNYLWTFGTTDTANAFEPNYTYHNPGDYVLKLFAYNDEGCVDKSLSYIQVRVREQLYIPTAFSPNNDNINDYFYVESQNIASLKITIFNRWGHFFYSSEDVNFRWDGTFHGEPVPLGVYGYLLTAIGRNGSEHKINGTISIVR